MKMKEKKPKVSESDKVMFLVLRPTRQVTYYDPFEGKELVCKIAGMECFLPVYKTEQEANDASLCGKYGVYALTLTETS